VSRSELVARSARRRIAPATPGGPGALGPIEGGAWCDGGLLVRRLTARTTAPEVTPPLAATTSFRLRAIGNVTVLEHTLSSAAIDNSLASKVATELIDPGLVQGDDVLSRAVTGIVRSMHPDPESAWTLFYGNTLGRLAAPAHAGGDEVDAFGRIYRRAIRLTAGRRVVDVGTCLGWLPLLLDARGELEVLAADRWEAPLALLRALQHHTGTSIRLLAADSCMLPLADRSVDTALAVHLLEHLDEQDGMRTIRELCRVARERVIIAVPFEAVPDAAYGHVRVFDLPTLSAAGRASGWHWFVDEQDGGWLVLDRPRNTTEARTLR
jgi:SAM-dependent methyltransferase